MMLLMFVQTIIIIISAIKAKITILFKIIFVENNYALWQRVTEHFTYGMPILLLIFICYTNIITFIALLYYLLLVQYNYNLFIVYFYEY